MVQGMKITLFTSDIFSFDRYLIFFTLNENYKLKNLFLKKEKVLTFLSATFFNLE